MHHDNDDRRHVMTFRPPPARHWRSYSDDKLPTGAEAASGQCGAAYRRRHRQQPTGAGDHAAQVRRLSAC
jgi:hypothetical protein